MRLYQEVYLGEESNGKKKKFKSYKCNYQLTKNSIKINPYNKLFLLRVNQ